VTRSSGTAGVRINIVPALHSDAVFNTNLLLTPPLGRNMADADLTAYNGLANGYVLTFTNGLTVYLSGDTGPTSEMAIMRDLYHPRLAVVNVDGVGSMGPEEAAYAMKQLVQPTAVIASHPEEPVTTDGRVNPETRTAQFIGLLSDMPVYVPLSGRTMEFDGEANCVGCSRQTAPAGNPVPGR
jgi:L-ascorbate metabolism protein UlaG (beta-lactamase superfamily)